MPQLDSSYSTTRLFSIGGSGFDVDIVASNQAVTLSLSGRTHDVTGWPRASAALANLSIADARRLSALLLEASDVADSADDERQVSLFHGATSYGCRA